MNNPREKRFLPKRLLNTKAFSLTELILAFAILAFALPVIVLTFIDAKSLNESSRNRSVAMSHLQYLMEEIKGTSFGTIQNKANNGDWNWTVTNITAQGLNALNNESLATTASGTTTLTVVTTARWTERSRNKNLNLTTLVVQP